MKATLIDSMGNDSRVVDAARVSFRKLAENYTDTQNEGLLKYLAAHKHWTPFSHVMVTMHEKVPIFVARQRFKHMVGFTYNEVSRRYVDDEPEFFVPDAWRKRAENKKQGSSDEAVEVLRNCDKDYKDMPVQDAYLELMENAHILYDSMLKSGVAPEQARMVLPQSLYTEYYCTGSLAAWARAYSLRIDPHAQKEIQDLAHQWGPILETIAPISWRALTNGTD